MGSLQVTQKSYINILCLGGGGILGILIMTQWITLNSSS